MRDLEQINKDWEKHYDAEDTDSCSSNISNKKRVSFANDGNPVQVNYMKKWQKASQKARMGRWRHFVVDHNRYQRRSSEYMHRMIYNPVS